MSGVTSVLHHTAPAKDVSLAKVTSWSEGGEEGTKQTLPMILNTTAQD
jgi:hypothetical protein